MLKKIAFVLCLSTIYSFASNDELQKCFKSGGNFYIDKIQIAHDKDLSAKSSSYRKGYCGAWIGARDYIEREVTQHMKDYDKYGVTVGQTLSLRVYNKKTKDNIDKSKGEYFTALTAAGGITAQSEDVNLFGKHYNVGVHDETGYYFQTMMFTDTNYNGGGTPQFRKIYSRGYVLNIKHKKDKERQTFYREINVFPVNFAKELSEIAKEYITQTQEKPLFLINPSTFMSSYQDYVRHFSGDDIKDEVHKNLYSIYESVKGGTTMPNILSKLKVTNKSGLFPEGFIGLLDLDYNPKTILADPKTKIIEDRILKIGGGRIFTDNGYNFAYATTKKSDKPQQANMQNQLDMVLANASLASTIMAKYNLAGGQMILAGLSIPDMTWSPDGVKQRFWKSKKKHRRRCKNFESYSTRDGVVIFNLVSNNAAFIDNHKDIPVSYMDFWSAPVSIGTMLPFADAVKSPAITHQGHILPYTLTVGGWVGREIRSYYNNALAPTDRIFAQNTHAEYRSGNHQQKCESWISALVRFLFGNIIWDWFFNWSWPDGVGGYATSSNYQSGYDIASATSSFLGLANTNRAHGISWDMLDEKQKGALAYSSLYNNFADIERRKDESRVVTDELYSKIITKAQNVGVKIPNQIQGGYGKRVVYEPFQKFDTLGRQSIHELSTITQHATRQYNEQYIDNKMHVFRSFLD